MYRRFVHGSLGVLLCSPNKVSAIVNDGGSLPQMRTVQMMGFHTDICPCAYKQVSFAPGETSSSLRAQCRTHLRSIAQSHFERAFPQYKHLLFTLSQVPSQESTVRMGHMLRATPSKGKMKACDGEAGDENWPRVVDDSNRDSVFSFDAISREPLTYTVPGSTEGSTSYNVAANLSEPFDQPVAIPLFTSSVQECFEPLDTNFMTPFVTSNANNRSTSTNPQPRYRLTEASTHHYSGDSVSVFSWEEPAPGPRYYAQALSVEDLKALAQGEKNHNLQEWSSERLVTHHEDREVLVPRVMPTVEKMNALADIEHHMQQSQRTVAKTKEKVRNKLHIPRIGKTTDNTKDDEYTRSQFWRSSQLTYDLCSSMLPPSLPQSTPTAPSEKYGAPCHRRYSHTRAASSGDYFSQPSGPRTSAYNTRRISPLASPSGPSSSNSSTRVRSPLKQEVLFRANLEATFDSFLVLHKSGKGEVLADSKNALKVKTPMASSSPSPGPKAMTKVRRLTKMLSMPLLRKRISGS